MLFDEGNGVFDLLCNVILHVVLAVAQRRSELEYRDAVLKLETLGDDPLPSREPSHVVLHCTAQAPSTGASSSMDTPASASGIGQTF